MNAGTRLPGLFAINPFQLNFLKFISFPSLSEYINKLSVYTYASTALF